MTAERSNSGAMPIPIPAAKPLRTKSRLVNLFIVDSHSWTPVPGLPFLKLSRLFSVPTSGNEAERFLTT